VGLSAGPPRQHRVAQHRTLGCAKGPERKKLVDQGYTIIVNVVGDQMSDLDGEFAERTYKLPNPFYFVP
jgi:hypothetical protein